MRTVIMEITYDRDIDFSTLEAMLDDAASGEGVVVVVGRLAHAPAVRTNLSDPPDPAAD